MLLKDGINNICKAYKIHIFPKVEGSSTKMNDFVSLLSSDFRGAWQAQFFCHSLEILYKCIFFEGNQMIFIQLFYNSSNK